MATAVITTAKRTPIGRFLGVLGSLTAVELGAAVASDVLKESGIPPSAVGEVVFGNARQAGSGPNPARQVAMRAGIPETTPASTVNKACGSGLKAIVNAYQAIVLGDAEIVLAGGTESMTNVPFMLPKLRFGYRLGNDEVPDGMYRDGFLCPIANELMGKTAENLAEKYGITREEQDGYAMISQHRCEKARKEGRFKAETTPVEVKGPKGQVTVVAEDEHPRDGVTLASLAKLPPVFKEGGTVHAGNSSGITDGAAAVLVMTEGKAKEFGLERLAAIRGYTSVGVDPRHMGIGPVPAVRALERRYGVKLGDFDLVELNEAFAAQVLACDRELHFDWERTNVNGGSIALGHPIGCTGTRFVVTLLHEMKKRGSRLGLATLCISGGLGMAVYFSMEVMNGKTRLAQEG